MSNRYVKTASDWQVLQLQLICQDKLASMLIQASIVQTDETKPKHTVASLFITLMRAIHLPLAELPDPIFANDVQNYEMMFVRFSRVSVPLTVG